MEKMNLSQKLVMGFLLASMAGAVTAWGFYLHESTTSQRLRKEIETNIDVNKDGMYMDEEWKSVYDSLGIGYRGEKGENLSIDQMKRYLSGLEKD